jgi:predicted phosphoadenosine phosphosulfate sulfurtransferase
MKNYNGKNVLDAARERIEFTFNEFDKIYLSFSGGKDSSVMFHLVMDEAIKRNRKIGILFIDLEGQYKLTIKHIQEMKEKYKEYTEWFWVCLPICLDTGVSVYQPLWYPWEESKKEVWIRDLPKDESVINDTNYFPFFRNEMEFEQFVPEFGKWYSNGEKTACFVGIRSDESLNRFRTIKNEKKEPYKGKMWTTKIHESNVYNAYPIYDWKTRDIWIYNGRFNKKYNELYDLMNKAGVSIHQQRICQPYGYEQRRGLWLYQVIEPDTWAKIIARVSGANSGAEFVQYPGNSSGNIRVTLPNGHTWKSFAIMLLDSMPKISSEHYRNKIHVYLRWWEERGYRQDIPDYAPFTVDGKDNPSWSKIVKVLLRNDYWCRGLSFAPTKEGYFYKKYFERIKKDRENRKQQNLRKGGRGWI